MQELGLVSVSFRNLSAEQIITLCIEAGLDTVEWGGDLHVPHGDIQTACRVFEIASGAGLKTAAYGSYYRLGRETGRNPDWQAVLDTACALHAPIIRIWVCDRSSTDISDAQFKSVAAECRVLCDMASRRDIIVCAECHPNTLTDDYHATMRLLHAVKHPFFKLYWQPNQFRDLYYNLESIRAMRDYITNVHAFYWDEKAKYPILSGAHIWAEYLQELQDKPSAYLLEFMPGDLPEELSVEAASLKSLLSTKNRTQAHLSPEAS